MKKIYVLVAYCGQYEDSMEINLGAYTTEDAANKAREEADVLIEQAKTSENYLSFEDIHTVRVEEVPIAPQITMELIDVNNNFTNGNCCGDCRYCDKECYQDDDLFMCEGYLVSDPMDV